MKSTSSYLRQTPSYHSDNSYRPFEKGEYGMSPFGQASSNPYGYGSYEGGIDNQTSQFTSAFSRFKGYLGLTAEETRGNMYREIMSGGDVLPPCGENEEENNGDDFTGDDKERVPIGDGVVPLLLMLAVYAGWKSEIRLRR